MLTPNELQMVLAKAGLATIQALDEEEDGPICHTCMGRLLSGRWYRDGYMCENCQRIWKMKMPFGPFITRCKNCAVPYSYIEYQHHYCDTLPEPEPVRRREAILATRKKIAC